MNGMKNNAPELGGNDTARYNQKNPFKQHAGDRVIARALFVLSALFAAVFLVHIFVQGFLYSSAENSAPFGVFILKDAIQYLLPSLILLLAGMVLRRADKKLKK